MLIEISNLFPTNEKFNFLVLEEESRFILLLKNLSIFHDNITLIHSIEEMDPQKYYFIPVKIPQIESLANSKIITNKKVLNILQSYSNTFLFYDLSTESITFSGYPEKVLLEFHHILMRHNIPSERVYLLCANSSITHFYKKWAETTGVQNKIHLLGYHFYLYEYFWEIIKCQWLQQNKQILIKKSHDTVIHPQKRKKYFLCLNLRPRAHRTAIVLHLLERNYLEKGYVTYFGEEFGHRDHESVDNKALTIEFMSQLDCRDRLLPLLDKLQNMAPLQYERDSQKMRQDLWHRLPGEVDFLIPEAATLSQSGIQTYFEIVTETWFTDNTNRYITEKTLRPILRLQPFIHVGAPYILKTLQEMGFKTFSPLIDESYDAIENPAQRMEAIFKEIDRLCNLSEEEIHKLYCDLWPRLLHNFHHFYHSLKNIAQIDISQNIFESLVKNCNKKDYFSMESFFFISTYDAISAEILGSLINVQPDISCNIASSDPFLLNSSSNLSISEEIPLDRYIEQNISPTQKLSGSIGEYSAYELHYKILTEKTIHPLKKVTLAVNPLLRIKCLMKSWLHSGNSAEEILNIIENKLNILHSNNHSLFKLYIFHYFRAQIILAVKSDPSIDAHNPLNQLFFLALTMVITQDSADLPVPTKIFSFEKILENENAFIELINYLTSNKITFSEDNIEQIKSSLTHMQIRIDSLNQEPLENWQIKLATQMIQKRFSTIYYPHIDKPLSDFYSELGYNLASQPSKTSVNYSKLISIHLNSNRPSQLITFFDNIEETADNPQEVEILVNIDENNKAFRELLNEEIEKRKFTLKYIETPRPESFCDLWQPINKLLAVTDPGTYFLLNISDEMLFATKGWDTLLKKYVGFFPDHLFRLRTSRNKFRSYFDRWECSFAQDSIPITTKHWVDIGGDWNPCFGPDSFQQLIAFYFTKSGVFSNSQLQRDIPIIEIKFMGDVPSIGLDPQKAWTHTNAHLKALFICQSHKMQQEANRRALLIKANILAHTAQLNNFEISDNKLRKSITLKNKENNQIIAHFNYKLSWLAITLANNWRKLLFSAYFGDGLKAKKNPIRCFLIYLKFKYAFFNKLHLYVRDNLRSKLSKLRRALLPTRYYHVLKKNWVTNPFKLIKILLQIVFYDVRSYLYRKLCKFAKILLPKQIFSFIRNSKQTLHTKFNKFKLKSE